MTGDMKCPIFGNLLSWQSDATSENMGYDESGTVSSWECTNKACRASREIFVPEDAEEDEDLTDEELDAIRGDIECDAVKKLAAEREYDTRSSSLFYRPEE